MTSANGSAQAGSDQRDLYQELILDHYAHPRHFGPLPGANRSAEGHNPLCGDQIRVRLTIRDGVVDDIGFEGAGCAISTASASVMADAVIGKTVDESEAIFRSMIALLTQGTAPPPDAGPELDKLEAFAGVRDYPMRVKCATLAWHTLHAALHEADRDVTTEEESAS